MDIDDFGIGIGEGRVCNFARTLGCEIDLAVDNCSSEKGVCRQVGEGRYAPWTFSDENYPGVATRKTRCDRLATVCDHSVVVSGKA